MHKTPIHQNKIQTLLIRHVMQIQQLLLAHQIEVHCQGLVYLQGTYKLAAIISIQSHS